MPLGLIAGNGRFPVLALETARELGVEVVAIGIEEEASKQIETLAARTHWVSLGALGKLIDICKSEGITELMMHAVGPMAQPFRAVGNGSIDHFTSRLAPRYFNYRKASIYAGSNEIQRNIIAKMTLGL